MHLKAYVIARSALLDDLSRMGDDRSCTNVNIRSGSRLPAYCALRIAPEAQMGLGGSSLGARHERMSAVNKDIVVVGASAGGVPALEALVAGLPKNFQGSVFVVLHMGASDRSELDRILQRSTALPVAQVQERVLKVKPGHIYVARPDYHLILEADTVCLTRGPRENRFRPAVDALFRSAAYVHSARVVGVILSGSLDDGAAGLWWVKQRGGTAIVQSPTEAQFPAMPESALKYTTADHVLRAAEIGPLLAELSAQPANPADRRTASNEMDVEVRIAKEGRGLQAGVMQLGEITPYTCPECHGILVQLKEGGVPRFRCHTGHAYSINTLLAEVTEYVEESLWNSLRSIEESAMLLAHLARHVRQLRHDEGLAKLFEEKSEDTLRRADVVRMAVQDHQTLSEDNITEVQQGKR
jgi:two-component system chemotaxis response regulator CheB